MIAPNDTSRTIHPERQDSRTEASMAKDGFNYTRATVDTTEAEI